MKKYFYLLYAALLTVFFYTTSSWNSVQGQGTTCSTADPFCTNLGVTYPAGTNQPNAPTGALYGCMSTRPNPAWFFMRIDTAGTVNLRLTSSPAKDIDYAVWGPFPACTTPGEACTRIASGAIAPSSCGYTTATTENPVLNNGQTGEVFIMLVTNFSNDPTTLSIVKTSGAGTTDCSIVFVNACPVDFGSDVKVCGTEVVPMLNASCPIPNPNYSFEWFVDGVSQGPPSSVSTFDPNHAPQVNPKIYKVVVTEPSSPCPVGQDEISVTKRPAINSNLTVFPNDSTLCSAGNAFVRVVSSQIGVTYQILRDGSPFGSIVTGTGGTILLPLTGMVAGISTIKVKAKYADAPTCEVTLTEQAVINVLGDVTVELGADSTICDNRTRLLDAAHPSHPATATYKWLRSTDNGLSYTTIAGQTNPTFTASEVLPVAQTPFSVVYKAEMRMSGNSCVFFDSVKITYEPLPLTDRIVLVDSVCNVGQARIRIMNPQVGARFSYRLRANNAGVPGAYIGLAQSVAVATPITFTTPSVSVTTKYFIEVKNTIANVPCLILLDVIPEVVVHPLPTAEFSGGANLCVGDARVPLTVTMTGTQPFTITYQRDGQPQITTINNINSTTYTFLNDTAGVYRITKVQDRFCENLFNPTTTTINVNKNPKFTLGRDTTLCDSQAPFTLTPRNSLDFNNPTYKWFRNRTEIVGQTTNTLVTTENSVALAPVTYEYILQVRNNEPTNTTNCTTLDTILVTFTPNPSAVITFAGSTFTTTGILQFCDSEGAKVLSGVAPDHASFPSITYEWKDLGTNTIVGANPTLTVNNFSASTNYQLLVTNGITPLCGKTATATIQFITNPVAEISHDGTAVPNGGSLDFCFDEGEQTLSGLHPSHATLGTVTYEWNDITNGVPLGNTPQILVSNPTNTFATVEYQLIVRNESNVLFCERTTTMTVNFYPNPEAQISYAGNTVMDSIQFCNSEGEQILDGETPDHAFFPSVTYQWRELTGGTLVGTTSTLVVNNFGTVVDYELTVRDGLTPFSCARVDTLRVRFLTNPIAEISHNGTAIPIGGSIDFCFDEGVQILNGVHPSHVGRNIQYEWLDITNGTPLGNTSQISVSNPTNTPLSIEYGLQVTDLDNVAICDSVTTITVNFAENPVAEIQFNGSTAPATLAFCDADGARTFEGALPSHAAFGSVSYVWTQVGVGVVSNISTLVTPVSNFSASATYTLEVISNDNPNLCSRTDQIVVEFFPSPSTDITFAGNVIDEVGFCTSEGTQILTAPASPFYTYQWQRRDANSPTFVDLGTNRTQSVDNFATQGGETNTATYSVVVTDTRASCPAVDSVKVNFYAEPEIARATLVVSASPITHCVTGTSTISVTNTEKDVEYQLTRNGTPVAGATRTPTVDLSTITFPVTESTTLTTGQSTFIYGIKATRIGAFGRRCTQTLQDTATVIIYPAPTATVSGTATVCANEPTNVTFTITGNFPATLTYQVTDTFNVVSVLTKVVGAVGSPSPQTFVINTNRNTYKPLSIIDRYCSGTVTPDEAIITTVHPPIVKWVEYDTAFCIDQPATFKVTGGLNHQYFINGLPVSTQNPYTIQANTLIAGTYQIYAKGFATANGCSANSDTITFKVYPLPAVDLGVDRIKCTDDTTYLVVRNTGSFIYDWKRIKTDNTVVSVGNGNDSLGVSIAGRYFVIVTNLVTGCSDSSNIIKIDNYSPVLKVNLGADVTICSPSNVPHRLIASDIAHPQGTLYKWYKENSGTVIGTDSIYNATTEGIYRVTVIDPRGCKAKDTIRVNFTADPDFRIIGHDDYACGVQDTLKIEATNLRNMIIDWQGNGIVSLSDSNKRAIVNVSGIYTVTVTDTSTVARCSTTKSVEVFVRPKIALTLPNTGTGDTTTLCQGDSLLLDAFDPIHDDNYEYRWKWLEGNEVISTTSKAKITYLTSESFTSQRFEVKVTDPDGGCYSIDTVNVRFRRRPIASINASDSVICLGESILLQGGESFGNRFEWIKLPETASFATSTNVTITPDSVGEHIYVLKAYFDSSTPCGAINDTIRIRVNRKAVAIIKQDEIRLCENEQLEINGFLPENPAFTRYIWTHEENNLILSTDSILNISFNEIQPISYEPFHVLLTVYDSLTGCDSTDRVLVKFNRSSSITIDSTYRTEVCLGDSVTLKARGATSYSWRKLGDTTNTILDSTSQITVKLDSVGYHTFIVTGGYLNECQNTGDTAIIYVNPLPTIRAHSVDTVSICAGDSITLYPSGGKNYVWLNDPTAFDTITVSPKVPTNYIVMGTDSNGCQAIDTVHVYVTPTFDLPALLQVCEGSTVMIGDSLNFADSSANVRATYFWTPTGETTPFINVGVSGTYTVEVQIDDCSFTRTTEVQVKPKPILELVSDTTLCFELGAEDRFQRGETHTLRSTLLNKDSATTYLYVWTDSTGQYLGNRDSLEIEAGGNYRLRVIARYATACETSDSTFVTELCQPRIFIPEAFTPNGDNLNDNFEIFGKHIKNFEMQIFNRWSEVMYEVRADDMGELQPQDFWDGTYKGQLVPTGAYIWIIRYTDPFSGSTKQVQKTGSFMIVR